MATTYTRGESEAGKPLAKILKTYHGQLALAGVTLEILLADNAEGPPVMHHGWPCKALIKINNLKDRAAGCADARLILDRQTWRRCAPEEQDALLDHELYHLHVKKDKTGEIKRDDLGRPKLAIRPHDWQLGGFDAIVERHGPAASEGQSAALIRRRLDQMEFDWAAAETSASGEVAEAA